ncbi:ER membrane protein complex subunit 10 isoform X2 [Diorhabda carinulata]|uniref:ER membrane protein complex subunit 10 isoform X2 n=1 Tax=Diorhabda carinulata TaxID=1163345 RepID=UPI0025A2E418|nr:ER membrane protein complex subunit 10 isoform X2 [Diorhabda carinulata]
MNFNQILFTLISIFASTLASNLEHDGSVVIRLQHSLFFENSPIWTERGNITIQSLRLGQATVDQKALSIEEQKSLRCMLAESELDDRLSVSIDYMGRVIGVTDVVASKSACEGAVVPLEKLKHFNTVVYVRHSETGPIPDTASYVQKLEREKEAKEKGETKDNRSFLAKYWMYIVPLLIFMAISSATNPEAQQAQ